jgi:hypothetical protein
MLSEYVVLNFAKLCRILGNFTWNTEKTEVQKRRNSVDTLVIQLLSQINTPNKSNLPDPLISHCTLPLILILYDV